MQNTLTEIYIHIQQILIGIHGVHGEAFLGFLADLNSLFDARVQSVLHSGPRGRQRRPIPYFSS